MMTNTTLRNALAEELTAIIDGITEWPEQVDIEVEVDDLPVRLTAWHDSDRNDETWTLYVDHMPNEDHPDPARRFDGHKQWRVSLMSGGKNGEELADEILSDLDLV